MDSSIIINVPSEINYMYDKVFKENYQLNIVFNTFTQGLIGLNAFIDQIMLPQGRLLNRTSLNPAMNLPAFFPLHAPYAL